jgi:iron(III) transport system permease protein
VIAPAVFPVRLRASGAPWTLVAAAAIVTAAVLLPPVYLVLRAAQSDAIWEMLSDHSTVRALGRTLLLTTSVTASCIAIAVPLAWLTVRTDLPLRRAWTVVLALPLAVPSFVGGFVMVSALGPGGLLQDALAPIGVDRLPSIYGFWGAWFVLTILSYPYIFLPVRAALKRADPATEEAARSLGKDARATFLRVNVPQMRPAISAGALLVSLYVLSEFGAVAMLRYDTLTPLVYIQYATRFDRSSAAVLGLPLIAMAALILAIDGATRGPARYYPQGQQRPARSLRLGALRWPAFAFCLVIAGLGLGLPVSVILYWLFKGLAELGSTELVTETIVNSARASAMAAVAAAAAALPIAVLSTRYRGWTGALLERGAYTGQALPAITVALALVFFVSRYVTPLYQTIWVLVFAYVVRFMPEALAAIRSSLLQVNPNTGEAARSLGARPLRVFTRITAPQMFPGVSAGMALVFLTAMKELPVTLLLSPIGFDTLATQVWTSTNEAFFTRAALPALILVAISSVPMLITVWREEWR